MTREFTFNAENKPLAEVFFSNHWKFRVPRFQRPYAWNSDQISDFWDDLIANDEPYFLGSFIFNTEDEKATGFVDIIDGQQRLITITIFMAVLRDIAEPLDPKKADLYHRHDICIEHWTGEVDFRITPAESIRQFFSDKIQNRQGNVLSIKPSTPEESNIKFAYQFLFEKVTSELERFSTLEQKIQVLDDLRRKVKELIVISVEISREEDAYEIFETTNARGLELSVSDLLKNLIFKNVPAGPDRDFAKEVWAEITQDIEETSTEMKRFIRYFWLSKYGFVPMRRLYKEIKRKILDWEGLLNDLWESSSWYNKLLEGDERDFQSISNGLKLFDSIFAIRLMRVSQCYVFLMCLLRNHKHIGQSFIHTVELIEKFTFIYSVVCKQPANRVERLYSKYAVELEAAVRQSQRKKRDKMVSSILSRLENDLRELLPTEALFIESFLKLDYRNSEQRRQLIKYILSKFNSYYQPTDEHRIDFNRVNIEHILPRKPNDEWGLSANEIKPYVNLLGNLTLLSKKLNSAAQNSTLDKKILEFEQSELSINKELTAYLKAIDLNWDKDHINQRHAEMARLAYSRIWAVT